MKYLLNDDVYFPPGAIEMKQFMTVDTYVSG